MSSFRILSFPVLACICCFGCQPLGSKVINETHPAYNCAMGSVIDRQMLSNLVRLRYRENPTFLDISSITESREDSINFGFDKEECKNLLLNNKFCSLTSIYYLCLKK